MTQMQPSSFFLQALFDILEATADVLSAWKIGLYTGNPTLTPATLLADLTQPTFTGYALVDATPPDLEINANGDYVLTWPAALFQATADVDPAQIATGAFLQATKSATPRLLLSGLMATPKQFAGATDARTIILQTVIPNSMVYGGIAAEV
jgi:hypothetical protein